MGFALVSALAVYVGLALRTPGGPAARIGRLLYVGCNVGLVALLPIDWGRGSSVATPLMLAEDGELLPLLPSLVAGAQLLLLAVRGWAASWILFPLAALGFVLFMPALILVEQALLDRGLLLSFMSPAPVVGLALSAAAPLFIAPAVAHRIPDVDSRLWRIAFRGRRELLDGIAQLAADEGWPHASARSILEAGSTAGSLDSRWVVLTTVPTLVPFRYALQIAVGGLVPAGSPRYSLAKPPDARSRLALGALVDAPWADGNARIAQSATGAVLEYRSSRGIPLGVPELRAVIAGLSRLTTPSA